MKKLLLLLLPDNLLDKLRCFVEKLLICSLDSSAKEQGLCGLRKKLSSVVPDIRHQYGKFEIDSAYLEKKVRGQHSFQVSMLLKALDVFGLNKNKELTIVDIGDSAGTHVQYLHSILRGARALSVDINKESVGKIRRKGLEAIHARAEDLANYGIDADLFLSFEMLEHLSDPIGFLYSLSKNSSCKGFVLTVPYRKNSRVALSHIRRNTKGDFSAENTHIFEFSPEDWSLIFKHSGWEVRFDQIYFQYPRKNPLRFLKRVWRNADFEGFYGVVLARDTTWSNCYQDW